MTMDPQTLQLSRDINRSENVAMGTLTETRFMPLNLDLYMLENMWNLLSISSFAIRKPRHNNNDEVNYSTR
jgi:hypothetical protein